jgi:putative redox protein
MPDNLKGELAREEALSATFKGEFFDLISDGNVLHAYKIVPEETADSRYGVLINNGYPSGAKAPYSAKRGHLEPDLCDRIAADCGCTVVGFDYRGLGPSQGDFSLGGWMSDLRCALDYIVNQLGCVGVYLVGFRTGGALCINLAANDDRVRGVITMGAQADFRDWASDPRKFLALNRELGMIRSADFPSDVNLWSNELKSLHPLEDAKQLGDKDVLVMHGGSDDTVLSDHAVAYVDAIGPNAELRILSGAGHFMRYDPRAIAVMLGWLERHVVI